MNTEHSCAHAHMYSYTALYFHLKVVHFFVVQVYSVVNGVVSLELIKVNRSNKQQMNINHWLIEKGYAQRADESYLSKVSGIMRTCNKFIILKKFSLKP